MEDAAQILGAIVPKAADWSKFARLIEPGKVVTSVDGRMYRIASTVTGPDGLVTFKLADLQGKPVPVPSDFHPLTPAAAKFASWLRWVVAYNADFDAYVKHYIREAGLPVDERRNWATNWLRRRGPHSPHNSGLLCGIVGARAW